MAQFKTDERIYETSVTTGTGEYTLAGAVTGFQPASVIGANNYGPFLITDDVNWEAVIGTFITGPNRLQRTTVKASSNGGAAVNWGAGTKKIRCGWPAWLAAPSVVTKSVAGGTDVTLTAAEQRCDILVLTGALTANINIIVDTTPWSWPAIFNNTSGAYTVTVKTSGGTGKEIIQGKRAALYCDGVNVELSDESAGRTKVVSRSSNTILAAADNGKTVVATATFTQTLTAAATLGDGWWCAYRVESGATLTLDPNAAETIDGAATKVITGPASGHLYCNGANFFSVGFPASGAPVFRGLLQNVGLSVAMAGNAVTLALKGADGNDPSASNKVSIGFRSATLTNGAVNVRDVTAALSTIISSGSTGGTVSAQASRIWIGAIDNAGTVELTWFNALSGVNIASINEGGVISTTAEGGAGAADAAQTWYSTTARTNVPVTVLGYFESTQTTAGTWAAAASAIVVNPTQRPGAVVQSVIGVYGSLATGTTSIPTDDTIPQNSEGDQYMSQAITPLSAANLLAITAAAQLGSSSASGFFGAALFQDSTADALAASAISVTSAGMAFRLGVDHTKVAAGTSSTSIKFRAGNSAAGTTTFNGVGGVAKYGGKLDSHIQIQEIMA